MFLFFDTETTGFPHKGVPLDDPAQPHIVQIAGMVDDEYKKTLATFNLIVNPETGYVPLDAQKVHGISAITCEKVGVSYKTA